MSHRTSFATLCQNSFLAAILACCLAGCGEAEPETYQLSGTATFDGKPIPAGQIYFMPDGSKNNSGPAGFAQIHDGKFDTKLEGGKGHVAGPMIVKIEGFDPAGKTKDAAGEEIVQSLFPTYETTADLPKEDSTQGLRCPQGSGQQGNPIRKQPATGGRSLSRRIFGIVVQLWPGREVSAPAMTISKPRSSII